MALTIQQIRKLKKGQSLRVIKQKGRGDYHLDAKAVILGVGTAGCSLKVVEIISKGRAHPATDGKRLVATFADLEVLV
ncbi:MAG: hypothetical protein NT162_02760 [Candidatus Woesebacteria bacterium]|nr:hypothetical protein [Candidatus Woesebacteria bacterium]